MEQDRQEAMDINYKLGKYEEKDCSNCGQFIENYEDIKKGLCYDCQQEIDNY